jgi:hypothetical protein
LGRDVRDSSQEIALAEVVSAIFVSYSRADSAFALRLVEDLKMAGVNIWLDQLDIDAGVAWDRAVEDALFRCPSMLVILSDVSVNSENVRDEISFALSRQKRILPVLYRDCEGLILGLVSCRCAEGKIVDRCYSRRCFLRNTGTVRGMVPPICI